MKDPIVPINQPNAKQNALRSHSGSLLKHPIICNIPIAIIAKQMLNINFILSLVYTAKTPRVRQGFSLVNFINPSGLIYL